MSAEPIPSPSIQKQSYTRIEYGDLPRDTGEISEILAIYAAKIINQTKKQNTINDEVYKIGLYTLLTATIFIAMSISGTYRIYFALMAIFSNLFIFILFRGHFLLLRDESDSNSYSTLSYLVRNLKPVNSLASAILQDESSLTKGERLLLELRSSEADEAIIEATRFLKRAKWKDIP
ncbi:hypothetical protein [Armatimonas sp.]|uniref:hypothetical protein n=1 Tax=Armatimonas sp. TaxID=1872638 RepID=UPI00286C2979|nr:hypothetical protein [Armatimonas sp.]